MRRTLAALALAVAMPLQVLAAEVVVRPGETLSAIAERHGVSLSELMRANKISDADLVEAGSRLTIPGSGTLSRAKATGGKVTVKEGETLSAIAERHGMSLSKLLQLNGIQNPDHVEVGQSLVVTGAAPSAPSGKPAPAYSYQRGASDHVVRPRESLSAIAKGYGVSLASLVSLNGIEDPNLVKTGTRLQLKASSTASGSTPAPKTTASPKPATTTARSTASTPVPSQPRAATTPRPATTAAKPKPKPKPPTQTTRTQAKATPAAAAQPIAPEAVAKASWRSYGPLQVEWSNWQPMGDGSLVAPTLNASGQAFYLAVNCGARKLNATTPAGQWKTWEDPKADFERKLVTDLCKSRGA